MEPQIEVNKLSDGDRFYPTNKMLSVFSGQEALNAFLSELRARGSYTPEKVEIFAGKQGVELIDPTGENTGFFGKMLRSLQWLTDERENSERYAEELSQGNYVVAVKTESDRPSIDALSEQVKAANGYFINFYGPNVTEPMDH